MITGFNTEISRGSRVFHVQTEDKGRANPVVESLIYCGGEILTSSRTPYGLLATADSFTEDVVLGLMEAQHQSLIRAIRAGKFDEEGPRPFGHGLVSDRSLDEVFLDALGASAGDERIRLRVLDDPDLSEGADVVARLAVVSASEQPVEGASVRVMLLAREEQPVEMFAGTTDSTGVGAVRFELPASGARPAVVLFEATSGASHAEIRRPVQRVRAASMKNA